MDILSGVKVLYMDTLSGVRIISKMTLLVECRLVSTVYEHSQWSER